MICDHLELLIFDYYDCEPVTFGWHCSHQSSLYCFKCYREKDKHRKLSKFLFFFLFLSCFVFLLWLSKRLTPPTIPFMELVFVDILVCCHSSLPFAIFVMICVFDYHFTLDYILVANIWRLFGQNIFLAASLVSCAKQNEVW